MTLKTLMCFNLFLYFVTREALRAQSTNYKFSPPNTIHAKVLLEFSFVSLLVKLKYLCTNFKRIWHHNYKLPILPKLACSQKNNVCNAFCIKDNCLLSLWHVCSTYFAAKHENLNFKLPIKASAINTFD